MSDYFCWLIENTDTTWWHDSGDPRELAWALEHCASGVTTNPILIATALRHNKERWRADMKAVFGREGISDEDRAYDLLAMAVGHVARDVNVFRHKEEAAREGFVCAQVNPARASERDVMREAVQRLHAVAPNISVKVPASPAGLEIAEECIAEGVSMTITVSFTVAQVLAIGAMYRRACARAKAQGVTPGQCNAVIMIGRIDDYLRDIARDTGAEVEETDIRQAGIAVVKRAYRLAREHGDRATLCVAALRGSYHMTAVAGGDLIVSIHPKHQRPLLAPDIPRKEGIDDEVPAEVIERLSAMPEFRKAYDSEGLAPSEFLAYGATQRTLTQFVESGWKQIEAVQP